MLNIERNVINEVLTVLTEVPDNSFIKFGRKLYFKVNNHNCVLMSTGESRNLPDGSMVHKCSNIEITFKIEIE